jgi:hypothetical protein
MARGYDHCAKIPLGLKDYRVMGVLESDEKIIVP